MLFDISYDIYNHREPEEEYNPLAPVLMHEKEQYFKDSKLYRTIERFEKFDINNQFGLSLDEFLALPHEVVEMIFDVSTKVIERKNKNIGQLKAENKNRNHNAPQIDPSQLWSNFQYKG